MDTKSIFRLGVVAAAVAGANGYLAAEDNRGTTSQANQQVIENIMVTAQRREERLVDVPISITALSSDDLARSGISSTTDLERVTPGLELTFNGGFLQPAIRGVSSQGSAAGDSSNVAIYLDGVYMASQPGQMMDLPDAEQIQVLKGPQGTLYGQNATGGAIIITTKKPNMDQVEGKVSASYGNYSDVAINAYVSGPLSDQLAGSVAVSYQDRDGFRDDLVYGGEDAGLRSDLVRGKLLFQPTDPMAFTLSAYTANRKDSSPYSGQPYDNRSVGYVFAGFLPAGIGVPNPDWDETATSRPTDTDAETWGTSLLAEFDFPLGTLSSTTAYMESEFKMEVDVDYSFFHFTDVTVQLDQDFFVQELNFVSEQMGKWQFTSGLFYLEGTEEYVPNVFRFAFNPGPAPLLDEASALMTPVSLSFGYIDKQIWAAFFEVNYDLTDQLKLTIGGRYSEEDQDVYANYLNPLADEVLPSPFNDVATFEQFTPRMTLTYALTENSTIYASYGEGFKSGYLSIASAEEPPVDPEELKAYEIGYKGEISESLSVSAAVYHYDYQDLQVARYEAPNYIYQNAAEATIEGVELNATWHATDGLTLMAGLSFMDAEYDEFPEAGAYVWDPSASITQPNASVNIDASGSDIIRAPEVTGFINASYVLQTDMGEIGAFGSVYYNDGYNLEVTGAVAQESYTMVDGELSFMPAGMDQMRFVLWGRNLTDEDVLQSLLETPFASGVSYGAPRTFGVRAELSF